MRIVEFDYTKLEGRIVEKFGSKTNYVKKSNYLCRTSLFKKLKNRSSFTDDEMVEAANLLDFENGIEDIPLYFFKIKV